MYWRASFMRAPRAGRGRLFVSGPTRRAWLRQAAKRAAASVLWLVVRRDATTPAVTATHSRPPAARLATCQRLLGLPETWAASSASSGAPAHCGLSRSKAATSRRPASSWWPASKSLGRASSTARSKRRAARLVAPLALAGRSFAEALSRPAPRSSRRSRTKERSSARRTASSLLPRSSATSRAERRSMRRRRSASRASGCRRLMAASSPRASRLERVPTLAEARDWARPGPVSLRRRSRRRRAALSSAGAEPAIPPRPSPALSPWAAPKGRGEPVTRRVSRS